MLASLRATATIVHNVFERLAIRASGQNAHQLFAIG
jgi:hypothetical protein